MRVAMRYIETNTGPVHAHRCLAVQRYGHMSQYQPEENVPANKYPTETYECALCGLGLTSKPERFTPTAVELLEENYGESTFSIKTIHDGLRHLISQCQSRLHNQEVLEERTGVSVKSTGHWRSQRRESKRTAHFDAVVGDGLEVCFLFDLTYCNVPTDCDSWDDIIDAAIDGSFGMQPETNVAKSLRWLSEYREPVSKDVVNRVLSNTSNTDSESQKVESAETLSEQNSVDTAPENEMEDDVSQVGLGAF
jgi:hypothetical protein